MKKRLVSYAYTATCLVLGSILIIIFGLPGVFSGGAAIVGPDQLNPFIDSQYRFVSAYIFASGALLLWCGLRPMRSLALATALFGATLLGAAVRITSVIQVGEPPEWIVQAIFLEIALPLIGICTATWLRYLRSTAENSEII